MATLRRLSLPVLPARALIAALAVAVSGAAPARVARAQEVGAPAARSASVHGTVTDSAGVGISFAEVRAEQSGRAAVSDEAGRFRLERLAAGAHVLRVRRIGFRPETLHVRLADGETQRLRVVLDVVPQELEAVESIARRDPSAARLAGFRARAAKGQGRILTRERIERTGHTRFADLLRELPGVEVRTGRGGRTVRLRGARCAPLVFLDGFPATAGDLDLDMIDLSTVEGIEVHHSMITVPAELQAPRGLDRCGVIAVWFRSGERQARPR